MIIKILFLVGVILSVIFGLSVIFVGLREDSVSVPLVGLLYLLVGPLLFGFTVRYSSSHSKSTSHWSKSRRTLAPWRSTQRRKSNENSRAPVVAGPRFTDTAHASNNPKMMA